MCWCVGVLVCASTLVHRTPPKEIDFGREGGCGGRYLGCEEGCEAPHLAVPSTSARVQGCFDFDELARDMASNCARIHRGYKLVAWYNLVVPEVREGRLSTGYQGTTCVCYVLVLRMCECAFQNTWNQVLLMLFISFGKPGTTFVRYNEVLEKWE